MKIFVISLERALDRRAVITEQMDRLGLPFEFVDGVDGKQLSDDEVSELYDKKRAYRQEGRRFSLGEIGCALSHIKAYRKIVEDDIPCALILEDDAWLTPSIVGVLEAMEGKFTPDLNGVVLLQERSSGVFKKRGQTIRFIDDLFVCNEVDSAQWAHAYVVTRTSAQSLIEALVPVTHTADSWGWLIRHRVVKVYCMNRTLSTQNFYNLSSYIGWDRFEKNKWLFGKVTHKAYRAFWLACDILVSLKSRIKEKL
jgi:glycosyl transferase family 25